MASLFTVSVENFESRFSNDDKIVFFSGDSKYSLEDIKPYMAFLPLKEQDMVLMYYFLKKDQIEIAKILKLTQGGICHRLARAKVRLTYLIALPKFTQAELFEDLKDIITENIDLIMLWEIYRTTCQSSVGRVVKLTQSMVRHRLVKSYALIRQAASFDEGEKYKRYDTAFTMVSKNYNILHEVNLPKISPFVTPTSLSARFHSDFYCVLSYAPRLQGLSRT